MFEEDEGRCMPACLENAVEEVVIESEEDG